MRGPRTIEEMKELPIGGGFGSVDRIINGKTVRVPVASSTRAYWQPKDAPIAYSDETGYWELGQNAEGTWFRRPAR